MELEGIKYMNSREESHVKRVHYRLQTTAIIERCLSKSDKWQKITQLRVECRV